MSQLKRIADGVWGAETVQSIGMGASLPLRMTILQDNVGLILVAPIPIDDALSAELAALAPVHTLIRPNLLHYKYLSAAKQRYPDAELLGAPRLAEKRPELAFDGVLTADRSPSPALDLLRISGADKLSEIVFLHKPSRTLVVTDLVFNIPKATAMSWLVLVLAGLELL